MQNAALIHSQKALIPKTSRRPLHFLLLNHKFGAGFRNELKTCGQAKKISLLLVHVNTSVKPFFSFVNLQCQEGVSEKNCELSLVAY